MGFKSISRVKPQAAQQKAVTHVDTGSTRSRKIHRLIWVNEKQVRKIYNHGNRASRTGSHDHVRKITGEK